LNEEDKEEALLRHDEYRREDGSVMPAGNADSLDPAARRVVYKWNIMLVLTQPTSVLENRGKDIVFDVA